MTALDGIQARVDAASAVLQTFPRGLYGLTPDAIKASPEYRAAKRAFQKAFAELRAYNMKHPRRSR